MPPSSTAQCVDDLCDLVPDLTEELLSTVDQPLKVATDSNAQNREFLLCDYNRDGDSYRSPWSNTYLPAAEDCNFPSEEMRRLEVHANGLFKEYVQLYYEHGLSSVYCWELDDGFASCWLIRKDNAPDPEIWNSIHVIEMHGDPSPKKSAPCSYTITSSVILSLGIPEGEHKIKTSFGGTLSRKKQASMNASSADEHVANMGTLLEDMEKKMRVELEQLYFGKMAQLSAECRKDNLSESVSSGKVDVNRLSMGGGPQGGFRLPGMEGLTPKNYD